MGVGGKFWELLKPYVRFEGFDFLRNKKVAIDLSFWIVQQETAIKDQAFNPHLRGTFFRTINLFSKFGAFPLFVLDGTPSPLKSQARMARFSRFTGIGTSTSNVAKKGVSKERNSSFLKNVNECVELLELLGMPVLKANGEAEALCAQLNRDGLVDACITSDSDAFLFGATCVVKSLRPNSKEPFECYNMSDIEAGLGLKRKHLIAISLLVGNDHDLNGVQGIGIKNALRFVRGFSEDEIFNKLYEIGKGHVPLSPGEIRCADDVIPCSDESSPKSKQSHCSFCGHPGSKAAHFKSSCAYCIVDDNEGCLKKSQGFKCNCLSCDEARKDKGKKKHENWWINVCNMISAETNFPNDEIIEMYMCNNNGAFTEGPLLEWGDPKTDLVIDFLAYHQSWKPSFIRQHMLPMLSTMYLRELARNPNKTLLVGQYEFHSIQRAKRRYGHQSYVVKWKKAISDELSCAGPVEDSNMPEEEFVEVDDEPIGVSDDESIEPRIHVDGCSILTDESPELVYLAFPEGVVKFRQEKELKGMKSRKTPASKFQGSSELTKPQGVQLSITEFYRTTKAKPGEDSVKLSGNPGAESSKRKISSPKLSKSVRRKLLFG